MHMARHMERMHRVIDYSAVKSEIKSEIKEECDDKEERASKDNVDSDSQTNWSDGNCRGLWELLRVVENSCLIFRAIGLVDYWLQLQQ